jgi:hypothetical protein
VSKNTNILPDSRITYLLEVQIANQKKILNEFALLNERFDRIEEYVGMSDREKNKLDNFYNTKEVMEILRVSRNTLKNYRDKGVITGTKPGKKVLYTAQEINRIKEYKNKIA